MRSSAAGAAPRRSRDTRKSTSMLPVLEVNRFVNTCKRRDSAARNRQKSPHLIRTGQTRFINEEDSFLRRFGFHVLRAGEKTLQCSGVNTRLLQLLCGAGSWCETLYLITFGFSRTADDVECGGLSLSAVSGL